MRRLHALLVSTLVLILGLLNLNPLAAFDDPSPHMRAHERKGERLALATQNAPRDRVSDVACVNGRAETGVGTGFDCDGVDLLSFTPSTEMTASAGMGVAALGGGLSDIWGWVDPDSGDEYVMFGKTNGTAFYRITDPTNPVYLGDLPSNAVAQLIWFDIKVYADHAFIVSESAPFGMQVFDLTRLRERRHPQVFDEDFFYPLSVSAHNIAINEDSATAYIVGGNAGLVAPDQCASGLHMVDISTPTLPVFAGCHLMNEGPGTGLGLVDDGTIAPTAYIHDTHCVIYDGPDTDHTGPRDLLQLLRGPRLHRRRHRQGPPGAAVDRHLRPDRLHPPGLAHRGPPHFLMGDEGDETGFGVNTRTLVFDVTDLDNPTLRLRVPGRDRVDRPQPVHQGRPRLPVQLHLWPARAGPGRHRGWTR